MKRIQLVLSLSILTLIATAQNILTINKFQLIDCQIETNHLTSLGARSISRNDFEALLKTFISDEITEISIELENSPSALS